MCNRYPLIVYYACRNHISNEADKDDYINYLSKTQGLALIWWSSDNRFLNFRINSTGHLKLHQGNEKTLATHFTNIVRRQFLYTEWWTRELQLYWEMGLVYKWGNMANSAVKFLSLRQLEAQERPLILESIPEPIRLEHIYGPLLFLVFGLAVSVFAFGLIERTLYFKKCCN